MRGTGGIGRKLVACAVSAAMVLALVPMAGFAAPVKTGTTATGHATSNVRVTAEDGLPFTFESTTHGVVNSDVAPLTVVGGVPARVLRTIEPDA